MVSACDGPTIFRVLDVARLCVILVVYEDSIACVLHPHQNQSGSTIETLTIARIQMVVGVHPTCRLLIVGCLLSGAECLLCCVLAQ